MSRCVMLMLMIFAGYTPDLVSATFSRKGKWGVVEAGVYRATISKSGKFDIAIKDTITLRLSFIERWKHYQNFPAVKFVRATIKQDRKANEITFMFEYLWNGGNIKECLKFGCRKIALSYSYAPWEQKNTRWLTGLIQVVGKKKPGMHLVGMYSGRADGGQEDLGPWRNLAPRLQLVSLRNIGPYVLDIAAEGQAWLNVWKHSIGVSHTNWKKPVVRKGETFTMKYLLYISARKGRNLADSQVRFVLDKRMSNGVSKSANKSTASASRANPVNHKKRGMIGKKTEPGGGLDNAVAQLRAGVTLFALGEVRDVAQGPEGAELIKSLGCLSLRHSLAWLGGNAREP